MIKPKKKICDGCGEPRFIWKNSEGKRFCKMCWSAHLLSTKKQRSLPSRSPKKTKEDSRYSNLRKEFLLEKSMCEAHISGICSSYSTDVHHKKGRGKHYLDVSTWLSVCRSCHNWIETNPKQAKQLGFSETRLK